MKKLHLLELLLLIVGDTVLTKDAANSPLQVKDQEADDSEENSQDQGNQTTTIGFTTSALLLLLVSLFH